MDTEHNSSIQSLIECHILMECEEATIQNFLEMIKFLIPGKQLASSSQELVDFF